MQDTPDSPNATLADDDDDKNNKSKVMMTDPPAPPPTWLLYLHFWSACHSHNIQPANDSHTEFHSPAPDMTPHYSTL